MRISDWSSDVCSSDLDRVGRHRHLGEVDDDTGAGTELRTLAADVRRFDVARLACRLAGQRGHAPLKILRRSDFLALQVRSEARRVGTGCFRTRGSRLSTYH